MMHYLHLTFEFSISVVTESLWVKILFMKFENQKLGATKLL